MGALIIIVCSIVVLLLMVLFSPVTFRTEFAISREEGRGKFLLSWIHPFVVKLLFDSIDGRAELKVFGRCVYKKTQGSQREATREEKVTGPARPSQPASGVSVSARDKTPAASKPSEARARPTRVTRTETRDETSTDPAKKRKKRFARLWSQTLFFWNRFQKTWHLLRRHRLASRVFRWCTRLLVMLFRIIRFDHARISVRAGMEDPAALGTVYGWCSVCNKLLFTANKRITLEFEPKFMENQFACNGSIGFRSLPARALLPFAVAFLTFPWLRAYLVWRRLKTIYKSESQSDIITETGLTP
jgi:hypothetical protein